MSEPRIFDRAHYGNLNHARGTLVTELLGEIKDRLGLHTAIDVGCGLGHFSALLDDAGMEVTAVDGRQENVEEASRRYPGIRFEQFDVQDKAISNLGKFDLVFCFGLLYHLENPMLAVRHLRAMTSHVLMIEGVIYPGNEPIMALIDEEIHEDQGLNHLAFYPTEACLVKIMYRAGFPQVYGFKRQPDHSEYRAGRATRRIRTMLVASLAPLSTELLKPILEPSLKIRPWDPEIDAGSHALHTLGRFGRKALPEKIRALKKVIRRVDGEKG